MPGNGDATWTIWSSIAPSAGLPRNKLSLTEFRQTLERDAIGFDTFREELRNEILMNRLRDREVTGKITVSEGEIENLLLEQSERKDTATNTTSAHSVGYPSRRPGAAGKPAMPEPRKRSSGQDGAEFAQLALLLRCADGFREVDGLAQSAALPELYVEASRA